MERVGSTYGVLHLFGGLFCLHGEMVLGKQEVFFSVFFYRTLPEAWGGHSEVATVLLGAGAEVNAQNNEGETALMLAVKKKKTECRKSGPIIFVWVALGCFLTLRGLYRGILFFPAPVLCLNLLAMYLKSLKFRHLFFVALLVLTPWNASQSASG